MISKLLSAIKSHNNTEFMSHFNATVNQSHRVLLLETSVIHDNLETFKFLMKCTSLSEDDYFRIAITNLSAQKSFRDEYCFYKYISQKHLAKISGDDIKKICQHGSQSSMKFMDIHPVVVHINFNWFVHYGLKFKNEEFLEKLFNSPLTKHQVTTCCMAVIHHKEDSFLPIILEAALENNINIDFKSDPVETKRLISTYLRNLLNKKDGPTTEKIMDMLVEEQIKAMEVTLYECTKNLQFSNKKSNVPKF